jgi:ABC-2 type transport system ATP-binding protein
MGAMQTIISVKNLSKVYKGGFQALKNINLDIRKGEILALLGPNGAGKTTLINIICGIVTKTAGSITVDGHDTIREFRAARQMIGLVPQELHLPVFDKTISAVVFSRALYGKPADAAHIENILRLLSLWDKKDQMIMTLSGGMKRRLLIAKALAHEPQILFLDEPTAGVDVELRKEMWNVVRDLRASGVTIILTTHYIDEAEEMADRVGIIRQGELILVEDKAKLIHQLGQKRLTLQLAKPLKAVPKKLAKYGLTLNGGGREIVYRYDGHESGTRMTGLFDDLSAAGVAYSDLHTEQSSLEEIFVGLVKT